MEPPVTIARQRSSSRIPLQPTLVLMASLAVGPMLFGLVFLAGLLGRHLPVENVTADYLAALLVGAALTISIVIWPLTRAEQRAVTIVWVAKLFTACVFMLLYEERYSVLDAYTYFVESKQTLQERSALPLALGTRAVVEVFAAFWSVFPPSFHLTKVLCSYLALIGIVFFYKAYCHLAATRSLVPLYVLGFTPSVLFWSSIAGKDPLILLGMGIASYGAVRWLQRPSWSMFGVLLVGCFLSAAIRAWIGALLLLTFILAALLHVGRDRRWRYVSMLGSIVIAVSVVLGVRFLAETGIGELLIQLETVSNGWAEGGAAVNERVRFESIRDVFMFLPWGAFTALFRPLPGEVGNIFGLMAGVESAVLLCGAVAAAFRIRLLALRSDAVIWIILFTLAWAALYAFLSYQNLGTAVRFRAQVLPFMLAAISAAWISPHSGRNRKFPSSGSVGL